MKDEEVDRRKGGETGGYKQHSSFVGWLAEPVYWKKRRRHKTKKYGRRIKKKKLGQKILTEREKRR